jgi:leukotriene-A4 hydrolase
MEFAHLSLELEVDFQASVLRGVAKWQLTMVQPVTSVVLDTRGLAVSAVTVLGAPAAFSMGSEHAAFGTPMMVELPDVARQPGTKLELSIAYATTPASSALGWLPPAQTAGKVHPYVFSQCQAIHARALVPCADAPAVKFTYDATLIVPNWAVGLMSAVRAGSRAASSNRTAYAFTQAVPMPSYLLALAVGQLESREIGPRSAVWAEPSVVEAAA